MSESRPFTLAHYRVTAAIGAGGIGEVYRATDTTLGREVAIKVLPPEMARDPERLARFEREAKLLASLNHSGIAHVYGFERANLPDGSAAHLLVMELVLSPLVIDRHAEDIADLGRRLPPRDKPPPVREILRVAEHGESRGVPADWA